MIAAIVRRLLTDNEELQGYCANAMAAILLASATTDQRIVPRNDEREIETFRVSDEGTPF